MNIYNFIDFFELSLLLSEPKKHLFFMLENLNGYEIVRSNLQNQYFCILLNNTKSMSLFWILIYPFYSLTLNPFSYLLLTRTQIILPSTMLLTILPRSMISATICPIESSNSMLFVIDVLTFIFSAISPLSDTSSVHLVVLPLSLISSIFAPNVDT